MDELHSSFFVHLMSPLNIPGDTWPDIVARWIISVSESIQLDKLSLFFIHVPILTII